MSRPDDELLADGEPTYFADPTVDRLMEVTLELAAELWVTRRRQALLERVLAERGLLPDGLLDALPATDREHGAGRAARDEFLGRVLAPLSR